MTKHILQIRDRYTDDIIAEFETEQWHTPHVIVFYAGNRPDPTIQISRWVDEDYVTLEPAPIKPDDALMDTLRLLPQIEPEFDERFCIQDDGMIYETLEDWRASWDGYHAIEWEDVMVDVR